MKENLTDWLTAVGLRPGGDILAIQTLRNALMAASVLASAALVAMMGVLATTHLHTIKWPSMVAAGLLVASALGSLRSVWELSLIGFQLQFQSGQLGAVAKRLGHALGQIRIAGVLMVLALACAGGSIWFG
jgi:Protein of unknown function, DUF599